MSPPDPHGPIRSLHVVSRMVRGGIETWLMNLARQVPRDVLEIDLCLLSPNLQPGAYDEEFLALGGRIHRCPLQRMNPLFPSRFKKIVRSGGYRIVHSHLHHFSGQVLRMARQAGADVRISHSHNDTRPLEADAGVLRRAYLRLMKQRVDREATAGFACSDVAAESLYGLDWACDPRFEILLCGIGLGPFESPVVESTVRADLGIDDTAIVWGHVGSFHPQKNHAYLLPLFAEAVKRDPRLVLLLVGDGGLRGEIEQQIASLGIRNRVVVAGSRGDVPELMREAMDVFVFPSVYEGLGLVVIEAQAAGLGSVVSEAVPEIAAVAPGRVVRLPLEADVDAWLAACSEMVKQGRDSSSLQAVQASDFNIKVSADRLIETYRRLLGGEGAAAEREAQR